LAEALVQFVFSVGMVEEAVILGDNASIGESKTLRLFVCGWWGNKAKTGRDVNPQKAVVGEADGEVVKTKAASRCNI